MPLPVILVAVVIIAVPCVVLAMFFNLWLQAKASNVPVSLVDMLLMRLRRVSPETVVNCMISMSKAGISVDVHDLETHVLSGGDLLAVTEALISADKADLDVDFQRIAAIDLAGRDIVDAVNTRVSPKVLICPPPRAGITAISGVAKDGVRLAVRARVTVRTQLERLVGGAGEGTVIARVGEGIVTAIGSAESHRDILEKPETISEFLLAKGLDSGTCFEILSVDIADVDVIDNVAARLQSAQAETDKRIAQAHAEVRRAAAVAAHQEMKARTTEMESRVVAAKAVVPLAVSSACCEANLGRALPMAATVNPRMRWKLRPR